MKNRWYKSGKELLNEIEQSARAEGSLRIWYLGQHGFVFGLGGRVFYIDVILNAMRGKDGKDRRNYPPPFSPDKAARVDYYIATHNHGDHLNLDTILPLAAANPDCVFIVPKPWVFLLVKAGVNKNRVLGAQPAESIHDESVIITAVPAIHTRFIQDDGEKDKNGDYTALGFVFSAGGLSFYHPGDTWINPMLVAALKSLGPINVAALPINGTDWERTSYGCVGNVNAMDAVKLAMEIPIDLVIPCHYDMMSDNTENPAYFADCMYRHCPHKRFHIMALGEQFIYRA